MVSDALRELFADSKVTIVLVSALLLVVVMVAAFITYSNIVASADDFRRDCEKIGGEIRVLGDDTLCMIGNQVIGRR